ASPRPDPAGQPPARRERPRGLRAPPGARRAGGEDRHADGGRAGGRRRAGPRRGRGPLSDQAVLAGPSLVPGRSPPAAGSGMAARIVPGASEDLATAYRRLNAAYQQTLRYAEDVRRLYQQVQRSIYQSLLGLANALEAKDACTRGHSERVGAWSRGVAAALGLPPGDVDMIGQAGLLHDIGKIGIPEAVLRKPGALDAEEWAVMRT